MKRKCQVAGEGVRVSILRQNTSGVLPPTLDHTEGGPERTPLLTLRIFALTPDLSPVADNKSYHLSNKSDTLRGLSHYVR